LELLVLLLTGGLAGWVAGTLIRGAGFGVVINIVVGVIGGIIGGRLFTLAGLGPEGWLMELAAAVVGAVLLLGLVNLLRRSPPEG
jgi:uncharacterized membrane protein YeaQ/YmgE (transglycosylase-associated protein family)